MSIKAFLLSAAVLLSFYASGQDKIYKKNGDIIEAKVSAVTTNTVCYKRFNNQDGPDYTILRREISKIVYQNGTEDSFEGRNIREKLPDHGRENTKGKSAKPKFGDNIICISPVYTIESDFGSDFATMNDPGIGISYERLLDKNGHISFYLPVVFSFASNRNFYLNSPGSAGSGNYTSIMFMPGVKFYPAPSTQRFRYSLGASFFAMTGDEPYGVYDYGSGTGGISSGNWRYTLYGIMIANSLNMTVNKHLFIGFDLGSGIPFSDNRRRNYTFIDNPVPLFQFGVKIGARF
jgi:hypothetical protein